MPCGSAPTSTHSRTPPWTSRVASQSSPRENAGVVRGLLDTSIVIDLDLIDGDCLPNETAISAITLAELAAGPHATSDREERSRRQDRLVWAASLWDPLPFDAAAARSYGRVYAAVKGRGRSTRRRLADLLIAAIALANDLPLYTRNPADFEGLERLIAINVV